MFVIETAIKGPKVAAVPLLCLIHRHHSGERLQFRSGLAGAALHWQHLQLIRAAARELEVRGELTPRRKRAAAKALWPIAHWIAYTHLEEGAGVADWIAQLDPEFRIPERGALGWLYRRLGFRGTERILLFRRSAKKLLPIH
jgi:hypothetical protein